MSRNTTEGMKVGGIRCRPVQGHILIFFKNWSLLVMEE